ncbi:MAG TPA: ElyC/SanA/YdcF family protein [Alphaproteobacteria bacterium]|nr:ElyC/SanA/YdcF family protein [Alphaproteobacteria bacterium]
MIGSIRSHSRRLAVIGGVAAALAILWVGGLVWFSRQVPTTVEQPDATTDAIVVLTGGSERLEAGLALLEAGRAKKLFVSGVYRGVEVNELLRLARRSPAHLDCCIALGHAADSTYSNAMETAVWMAAENYHSLLLVTAAYHMPRSLLEFRRAMPGIKLIPHPVFPERVKSDWWLWPGSAELIIGEYDKYLLALARDGIASLVAPHVQSPP